MMPEWCAELLKSALPLRKHLFSPSPCSTNSRSESEVPFGSQAESMMSARRNGAPPDGRIQSDREPHCGGSEGILDEM